MMANWFEKILPSFIKKSTSKKSSVPEGLWQTCSACSTILYVPDLEANLYVCPKCDQHIRIGARKRLDLFLDQDNQKEIANNQSPVDWLKFKDTKRYKDRLSEAEKISNLFIDEIWILLQFNITLSYTFGSIVCNCGIRAEFNSS